MDACRKIWFYTPAQTAAQIAALIGLYIALIACFIIF